MIENSTKSECQTFDTQKLYLYIEILTFLTLPSLLPVENELLNFYALFFFLQTKFFFAKTHSELHSKIKC